jgi:hypothetical protein
METLFGQQFPPGMKLNKALRGHSYATLEREAAKFRAALQYDSVSPIDGLDLWNRIPVHLQIVLDGRTYRVDVGVEDLPRTAQASYDPDREQYELVLSPLAYALLENGNPKGNFDLDHECAHIWLHARLLQKRRKLDRKSLEELLVELKYPHRYGRDVEWQANAMAAAVLMPATGIRMIEEAVSPSDLFGRASLSDAIAQNFKVSSQSAGYRWDCYVERKRELLKATEVAARKAKGESIHSTPWKDWDFGDGAA